MEKICEGLKNIIKFVIYVLFLFIIVWLVIISGFSTSNINIDTEYTYFVSDNVWRNLFVCIAFMLLLYGGCKGIIKRNMEFIIDKYFVYVKKVLFLCIGVIGLVIVLSCNTIPRADQLLIMDAAYELRQGDYTMFAKGNYMQMCQNQNGIVVFIYFLSMIIGNHNYIAFQVLNVLALVLIYYEIAGIVKYLGMSNICQLAVLIFGIVFLPLTLYTTFVYGTIISLAFSILALRLELLYFRDYKTKDLLMACLAIIFSVILKSNALIFMIAMIIYAFIKMLGTYKTKAAIFIMIIIILYLVQSITIRSYIELKTGQDMEKGISSWAYIAMGLQEGYKADGWWNGYNRDTYYSNDCDSEKQEEEAKAYIKERLKYFCVNKEYTVRFMGHKLASQWNNPTFQCFWVVNMQTSNIDQPEWIKNMYSIKGQDLFEKMINPIQFIIFIGCLIFTIFDKNRTETNWILLQLTFVGGFLFYAFWEAKCQYTLPYFMLLIPMAIKGYSDIEDIVDFTNEKIGNKKYVNKTSVFIMLFLGIMISIQFSNLMLVKGMIKIDDNEDKYKQYVVFNTTDKIKDGDYNIFPFTDNKLSIACLDLDDETNSMIGLLPDQQDNIWITTQQDKVYFQFKDSVLYLDLSKNEEIENGLVQAHKKNNTNAQKWVIKKDENNQDVYFILIGKQSALSYDKEGERICIKEFSGNDDQKWIIK